VGAGSAGAILAARLTEDPGRSVVLIEAGPDHPDHDDIPNGLKYGYGPNRDLRGVWPPDHTWYFVARRGPEQRPMLVPRGKVTGGSSAVNAQIFLRGLPDDYDRWAALGNDKWSFKDLLPYFRRIETDTDFGGDFHGSDGPIVARRFKDEELNHDQRAFYEAARAAGYSDCPVHNDPSSTGVGPTPLNNRGGVRVSTAMTYLGHARERPNLTIMPDSLAHRVVFEGRRAVGTVVETEGRTQTVLGHEIVLSSGAIGSPHLLLLSGVGPADHLRHTGVQVLHDLPGVGKNLRDTFKFSCTGRHGTTSNRTSLHHRYRSR
jgi:choline dehydrogenase